MSPSRIVSAGVLAAIAGLPLSAAASIFTFSPVCNGNWYAECTNGLPCTGGGWQTFNNWGQSGCAGGLPTPGAADDVLIGTSSVAINGNVSINSLTNAPGGFLRWSSGTLSIVTPFTNLGSMLVDANHKTLAADIINEGVLTAGNSWNLYLYDATITNNATFVLSGDKGIDPAGGSVSHAFINTDTVTKTDGGTVTWGAVPIDTSGVIESISGNLHFSGTPITSTIDATWRTNGGAIRYYGCSFEGYLDLANNNVAEVHSGWSMPADLTLNATVQGLSWVSGNLSVSGGTLTNAPTSLLYIREGHKTVQGAIRNQGEIAAVNGWNVYFSGATLDNAGLLRIAGDKVLTSVAPATDSVTNSGTIRKTDGGTGTWSVLPLITTGVVSAEAGNLHFQDMPITSSPPATWSIGPGGALRFYNCTLDGLFSIENANVLEIHSGWAFAGDSTLAAKGGGVNWVSGNLSIAPGTTLSNDPASILYISSGHKSLSGTLVNQGQLVPSSSWNLYFSDATLINSGEIRISGDKGLYPAASTTNLVSNTGMIRKTDGATGTWGAIPLVTTGSISAQAGNLEFRGTPITSEPSAAWSVTGAGAALRFYGCLLDGVFTIDNANILEVHDGWTFNDISTLDARGAGLNWVSGNLAIPAAQTLTNAPTSTLYINSGHKTMYGTLINRGQITTINGWNLYLTDASISNLGTFRVSGDKGLWVGGGTAAITNAGVFTKTDGGTGYVGIPFTTTGPVSSLAGNLWFQQTLITSSPSAAWAVGDALLRFDACSLSGTFNMNSAGTLDIHNGWSIASNTVIAAAGNGISWVSGNLGFQPGAVLTNAVNSRLYVSSGHKTFYGPIDNRGHLVLHNGWNLYFSDASISNSGTIQISGDKYLALTSGKTGTLNNLASASIRKTDGGTGTIDVPLTNAGLISAEGGDLRLWDTFSQSIGGVTRLAGGSLNLNGAKTFAQGRIEGSGPITGSVVTVAATMAPGGYSAAGTLNISGSLTQNPTSKTEIKIGGLGASEFDHITANTVSLGGTLFVRFFNGFRPMAGDTFTFLTTGNATGRSGEFANYTLLDPLEGLVITVDYGPSSAVVRVLQCTPCTPCDGDVNCDGALNGFDIETMEQAVNGDMSNYCQPDPDFNHDGTVNGFDIEVVEQVVNGGFCP